jgi:glycosyltransferase involved in cell wall biosynthesis
MIKGKIFENVASFCKISTIKKLRLPIMKIAIISTDNREHYTTYDRREPDIPTPLAALLKGFVNVPGIEIHVISCLKKPVLSPEKLADNIWFHSLVVPKLGWLRTLYQGCIRATRKKLQELQPDVVHGQGTERDCALSAVFSGFPNVVTIHGNLAELSRLFRSPVGSFFWLAGILENFTLRRTAGVFCNSTYTENLVRPRAPKTWPVPNALRLPFFEAPVAHGQRKPVLLNVGMMEPRKQQVQLLKLAGNLWRRGLRFEFQFAGYFNPRRDYDAVFVRELAVAEKAGYARHLGMLTTQQLISVMDSAAALVHVPTEEAFGLVVAEAMARNLKFFGFATGGVVDIASGVEGAELLPPSDWPVLEEAIARWIEAGCPRPVTAAETMRERYHPLVIARRHVEIYREVLGRKPG